jgi:hypothetical protein
MPQWEYMKVDLNALPKNQSDLDALNVAGADGWELVAISNTNQALLKRRKDGSSGPTSPAPVPVETRRSRSR